MCASNLCTNGLVNRYEQNILSFGEDFDGIETMIDKLCSQEIV